MALFRCLVFAVLVSATVTGCSQSLFSDGSGDDPGGRDGGPPPMPPDARAGEPDGGEDNRPDAGDPRDPDGGPSSDAGPRCPAPCLNDAYAEFTNTQGGLNGRWRYIEFQPEQAPGQKYVLMTIDTGVWVGTGDSAPSIVKCGEFNPDPRCFELSGALALTSGAPEFGVHFPGLMWTAPDAKAYTLAGTLQVASTAPETVLLMTITLNGTSDQIYSDTWTLTATPQPFQIETPMLGPDDYVVLTIQSLQEAVSVGMSLWITEHMPLARSW
jgi:hypothetical protein